MGGRRWHDAQGSCTPLKALDLLWRDNEAERQRHDSKESREATPLLESESDLKLVEKEELRGPFKLD